MRRLVIIVSAMLFVLSLAVSPSVLLSAPQTGLTGNRIGGCAMVAKRAEAGPSTVFTKNIRHARSVNQAYQRIWGRNARCDELQLHENRSTKITDLYNWLRAIALARYRSIGTSSLEGRTVSTARHEWFLVQRGVLRKIPDWPTALAWGLALSQRTSIPAGMTEAFYGSVTVGEPLRFADGPYMRTVEALWKRRSQDFTALPLAVASEVMRLVREADIFNTNRYEPRNAAFARLLDWRWLTGNPANVTVAYFGDQGFGEHARAVLALVRAEHADLAVHVGDFEYRSCPECWENQINEMLGSQFPYLAVVGNHDVDEWPGYQRLLADRVARARAIRCTGDLGVKSVCTFRGLTFVLSGIGTLGAEHVPYLRSTLRARNDPWTICAWHKNQELMQVGHKHDEVGWEAYELCRKEGAMIVNGHEHSYSRTFLMESFARQEIADIEPTLRLAPGKSFVAVTGLGGMSIREQNDELASNPWWATVFTKTQDANYGALFCTYRVDGDPNRASCFFKTIDGRVVDTFGIVRLDP